MAKNDFDTKPVEEIRREALEKLDIPDFRPEYFEIADGKTLLSVEDAGQHQFIVACCAVWAGDVRLIDNIIIRNN